MLIGTASVADLAVRAPTIEHFTGETIRFDGVELLQLTAEMKNAARVAVLPPALHPTVPATLSVQVLNIRESPWGPFSFAVCRVGCRSGVRARGFTTRAYATTAVAADAMASTFGYPCGVAEVSLRRGYDGADARVETDRTVLFSGGGIDPIPMGADDVQYTGSPNLASTPRGLRLVQVESEHHPQQVERLTPRIGVFAGEHWGNPLLVPSYVVSASIAVESLEYPPVRFVCRPEELAFTGTESVR